MAFVFRMLAVVPAAIRVGLTGGAAYGTAKVGVWSDSAESKEKLEQIHQAVKKEIHYPRGGIQPFPTELKSAVAASRSRFNTTTIQSAKDTWNAGVMKACETLATADGSKLKTATAKAYQQASDYLKK